MLTAGQPRARVRPRGAGTDVRADELILRLERRGPPASSPLHRQVFTQVRAAILEGRLRAGDRLPASRELAASLRVARNTVARAYEDLLAGGYIVGRVGSGSFVADGLDVPRGRLGEAASPSPRAAAGADSLSRGRLPAAAVRIDFRPGISDWEAFPRRLWLRLIGRALRSNAAELRRYGEPGGYFPLREAISRHLAVSRGVAASPQQVVICNGSQQALDLIARLCLSPGDRAAFEDPGYPEARQVLTGTGARPLHVPVDQDGMDVAALERMTARGAAPRLVYLTPSHQFPTGAVLPASRRLALLGWAARRDVLVVEDDYDSELRTPGRIVESLQGLDRAGKVIYVGTFSTVLFPPLRVGYLVLPPAWTERFLQAKWRTDRQTATLDQLALTAFLLEGHFERHLRAMRRLVAARREAMLAAIRSELAGLMQTSGSALGMHVMVRGPGTSTPARAARAEERITAAAASRGVAVFPVGPCWSRRPRHATFLLGYASLGEQLIRDGVRELARAAREAIRGR